MITRYIFALVILSLKSSAQNWQILSMPTTKDIISSSFINDNIGWIGTADGGQYTIIYYTNNGGLSWSKDTIDGVSYVDTYLEFVDAGSHEIKFDREQLASGIYFLELKTSKVSFMEKLVAE